VLWHYATTTTNRHALTAGWDDESEILFLKGTSSIGKFATKMRQKKTSAMTQGDRCELSALIQAESSEAIGKRKGQRVRNMCKGANTETRRKMNITRDVGIDSRDSDVENGQDLSEPGTWKSQQLCGAAVNRSMMRRGADGSEVIHSYRRTCSKTSTWSCCSAKPAPVIFKGLPLPYHMWLADTVPHASRHPVMTPECA
jgi:hypothetical protein